MLTTEERQKEYEEVYIEGLLYGSLYFIWDEPTQRYRLLSQKKHDITVTHKGYVVSPRPLEVVPHG